MQSTISEFNRVSDQPHGGFAPVVGNSRLCRARAEKCPLSRKTWERIIFTAPQGTGEFVGHGIGRDKIRWYAPFSVLAVELFAKESPPATGPSSGFSLLSPRGLAWLERKTGSEKMRAALQNLRPPGNALSASMLAQMRPAENSTAQPLPTKETAVQLVNRKQWSLFHSQQPLKISRLLQLL